MDGTLQEKVRWDQNQNGYVVEKRVGNSGQRDSTELTGRRVEPQGDETSIMKVTADMRRSGLLCCEQVKNIHGVSCWLRLSVVRARNISSFIRPALLSLSLCFVGKVWAQITYLYYIIYVGKVQCFIEGGRFNYG